jgi:NTE family protein
VDPRFPDWLADLTGRVEVIEPDEASQSAFGTNVLDPAVRTPAGHAGRAHGQREAARVAALWT